MRAHDGVVIWDFRVLVLRRDRRITNSSECTRRGRAVLIEHRRHQRRRQQRHLRNHLNIPRSRFPQILTPRLACRPARHARRPPSLPLIHRLPFPPPLSSPLLHPPPPLLLLRRKRIHPPRRHLAVLREKRVVQQLVHRAADVAVAFRKRVCDGERFHVRKHLAQRRGLLGVAGAVQFLQTGVARVHLRVIRIAARPQPIRQAAQLRVLRPRLHRARARLRLVRTTPRNREPRARARGVETGVRLRGRGGFQGVERGAGGAQAVGGGEVEVGEDGGEEGRVEGWAVGVLFLARVLEWWGW